MITSLVAALWRRRGEVVARTARCSTAALTAVLFKVSFVQLSAGEEVAVVREQSLVTSVWIVDILSLTVLQMIETGF